jgi:cytochrome c peroxidase
MRRISLIILSLALTSDTRLLTAQQEGAKRIGVEKAVARHLNERDLERLTALDVIRHGRLLFNAPWTEQDGAGRPLMKGNTRFLADSSRPLTGLRSFNRFSAPDANSCLGCHNLPSGGGSGDFVTNVFVLGQRFDFFALDGDRRPTVSSVDEQGKPVTLGSAANLRATTGMFGAGYLEMLAREITADLQEQRDQMVPGETRTLSSKGIIFGELTKGRDGLWNTSRVLGIPRQSLDAPTPVDRPSLIIRPWHAAANAVSLREFSNNAFHQHHGIQSVERFGLNTDPDGDGVSNELTRADLTAVSLYQATLAVPGRVISRDPEIEAAIWRGEKLFDKIGCAHCHVPELPLSRKGVTFEEPSPYNPPTNTRKGEIPSFRVELNSNELPAPRLSPDRDRPHITYVPAFTDFKLHDITDPASSDGVEPLDQNETIWSPKFRNGNRLFLTKRLWGVASEPPYFHHGQFTTLRQAVLAHHGEALGARLAFEKLSPSDRDAVIEFLKSLQILPSGTIHLIVDENYQPRAWPPVLPLANSHD